MMISAAETKADRLNLRLNSDVKTRVEKAASLEGKTVSRYIVDTIARTSAETISKHETMALSRLDADSFLDALSKPVVFNSAIQDALQQHGETVTAK
ncbi:DUF1778 domain-containing protein [Emcibacteraceae bacterium Y4]|uniref:type II toxin-antitoxin system TacA family antitoxin n=1 Tax=Pseudemcibacter aquimaris TaxID=2857064 RepID=UPI002012DD27|nr:DUF1778 domain-containing protein [Pseudemcibacter aquimaris]MCC3862541.1 DUF1778 domain-containing protein [Pseudemcibacter aquimaris]